MNINLRGFQSPKLNTEYRNETQFRNPVSWMRKGNFVDTNIFVKKILLNVVSLNSLSVLWFLNQIMRKCIDPKKETRDLNNGLPSSFRTPIIQLTCSLVCVWKIESALGEEYLCFLEHTLILRQLEVVLPQCYVVSVHLLQVVLLNKPSDR